jgi:uncharacterized lipoprotein YajG
MQQNNDINLRIQKLSQKVTNQLSNYRLQTHIFITITANSQLFRILQQKYFDKNTFNYRFGLA